MGLIENVNLKLTYLLISLKEVMGPQNCMGSFWVVVFKMLTLSVLQQPAHEITWQNYLEHWERMSGTFKLQCSFFASAGKEVRVLFYSASISEYKVSVLMDEACGCSDLLIKSMLKAGPSWAACMNSITSWTIISPVKVSMTSNPKQCPKIILIWLKTETAEERERQVVRMKTFPILHTDLKHFS